MSTDTLPVPVRPCEPWCVDGQDKHAEDHPDDRSCWSTFTTVTRSRGKPEKVGGVWSLDWLTVVARRHPNDVAPAVNLHLVQEDIEVELTANEARQLAAVLIEHADMVEALPGAAS